MHACIKYELGCLWFIFEGSILINVFILDVPTYTFDKRSGVVLLTEGSDYDLSFTVASDPPLESSTQHQLLKDNSSPRVGHVYLSPETSSICFRNVRKADEGKYTVCSQNIVGQGQAYFSLKLKCKL